MDPIRGKLSIPLEGLIIGQDQLEYGEQNGLCFIKFLILVRPYETSRCEVD